MHVGLDIVYQAAQGLAYAHDRGMVHRDIKPDNLLLRRRDDPSSPSGYGVRITDFGLVRLAEGGVQTADGVTMGTPAYISPEQCRGFALDGRSDIYSLGVVLFEVATGALPFETKTLSDAIFKHVSTPPPSPLVIRPDLPPPLAEIILRCLAKHPDDRFATARDLAAALRDASMTHHSRPPVPPTALHPTVMSSSERLTPILPIPESAPPRQRVRLAASDPAAATVPPPIAVAKGGTPPPSHPDRRATPFPFWLPIALILAVVVAAGGAFALSRGDEGEADIGGAAADVTTTPSTATDVPTTSPPTEVSTTGPTDITAPPTGATMSAPTATLPPTAIAPTPTIDSGAPITSPTQEPEPEPLSTGLIAFATGRGNPEPNGRLDIYTMTADGTEQTPLITGVGDDWAPAWSHDGTRLVWSSKRDGNDDIVIANADGTDERRLTSDPENEVFPMWSSDDTRILFVRDLPENPELFIVDVGTGTITRLTDNTADDGYAAWSPDGSRVAWSSGAAGNNDIYLIQADGSGIEQLTTDPANDFEPQWSPDGTRVLFVSDRAGNPDLYIIGADGLNERPMTSSSDTESRPRWSPDGIQVSFVRGVGDGGELIVMSADGSSERVVASGVFADDAGVTWSPDGTALVFQRDDDAYIDIWIAYLDGSPELRLTTDPNFDGGVDWRMME